MTLLDEIQGEKEAREGERKTSMSKRPGHGSSEDEDTARDRASGREAVT